jgi:K+-transporting ATPase ATPase A chain
MTINGWLQILLFSAAVLALTKPMGLYLTAVFEDRMSGLRPVERAVYALAGVDPNEDQHWTRYAGAMLLFSLATMLLTYVALRLQQVLPLNPEHLPAVADRQAFETAASFTTNTNWQSYVGETTMSYFSQMTQLTFHNFASAAVGIALAVALVRGLTRRSAGRLGNFWADLVRCTLYVLLPLSLICALVFVQQGAIQNFSAYLHITTLEGAKQTIAMGPNGEPPAARVGDLGHDVPPLPRRCGDDVLGRGERQSDPRHAWGGCRGERHAARRQHGRQGGAIRHRQLGAVRDGDH